MEKDQNINTENQDSELKEIITSDQDNEVQKNDSKNIDEVKEIAPEEKILEMEDKVARTFA